MSSRQRQPPNCDHAPPQELRLAGSFRSRVALSPKRRGRRGQTLTIAKWLGTLAPSMLFGVI
ncbi:MAG: hypothetical protein E6G75_23600, partial [Alphaproteobacteria bacterium]